MEIRRSLKLVLLVAVLAVAGVIGALLVKKQARDVVGFFAERLVLSKLPEPDGATVGRLPGIGISSCVLGMTDKY